MTEQRTALVTGSAGFIGFHLCQRLLRDGFRVIGLDPMTDYYDVALKQRRHQILLQSEGFTACEDRLEGEQVLHNLFEKYRPDVVVHLAAQAGVRYSIDNPRSYVQSNLIGTHELLEAGRAFPPAHMLLASTSSVYGAKHPNALRRHRQGRYADTQIRRCHFMRPPKRQTKGWRTAMLICLACLSQFSAFSLFTALGGGQTWRFRNSHATF